MKRLGLLLLAVVGMSFCCIEDYPCHPNGDLYPCTHPMHVCDGNGYYTVPCTHPMHPNGDVYPCTHYCY